MDLGCLDLGCVTFLDGTGCHPRNKNDGTNESIPATTAKVGKNKSPKESPQSNSSSVNRSTSQMKKPLNRKTSPINWFPRKKVDSYLKRKIKSLQEAGGMRSTLDETLGDANPHYCKVEREKIAVKEAARKAMEARKAAMVEASWCRILKAARINSKEAEALLLKAEKNVAEALEAATAKGVIMYSTLDCNRNKCVIETSPGNGKSSTTHTVRASFETAFEVDKQVAAAVKTALIQLVNCPSSLNKDEYHDLLRKISENPDTDTGDNNQELSEFLSECESDMGFEAEFGSPDREERQRKIRRRSSPQKSNIINLVEIMFERLKCLKEEELASLATIVATSGLGAALAQVENNHKTAGDEGMTRRMSNFGAATIRSSSIDYFMNGPTGKKQVIQQPEFPSLDKFLVKHTTKLEKEVQEARKLREKESREGCQLDPDRPEDLNAILDADEMDSSEDVKEEEEMERNGEKSSKRDGMSLQQLQKSNQIEKEISKVPSLDKFLVKRLTKLEREVQEAKNRRKESLSVVAGEKENINSNTEAALELEQNGEANAQRITTGSRNGGTKKMQNKLDDANFESLDKVLVKHVPRLEKEKMELRAKEEGLKFEKKNKAPQLDQNGNCGLDQILVKHKSRLEREKEQMAAAVQETEQAHPPKHPSISYKEARERQLQESWGGKSLGDSVRPQVSRIEREKAAAAQPAIAGDEIMHSASRREARKRELQDAWEGMDLGSSMRPQVSRLEREKAAAQQAVVGDEKSYSVSRREARQREVQEAWGGRSLGNSMCPQVSRLEREKAAAQQAVVGDEKSYSVSRREARQREVQEAWGGRSLGNSMCPQVSRLEREKAAAAQPADSGDDKSYSVSRKEARQRELQEAWGGMGLGNSMRPQVSRLEREKASFAAQSADTGNEKNHSISLREGRQRELQEAWGGMDLGNSMCPQVSRLEREKAAATQQSVDEKNHLITRKEARQRELQDAWGGMGLGNSIRPHVSRLEREKAAWMKAEEEERRTAAIPGL